MSQKSAQDTLQSILEAEQEGTLQGSAVASEDSKLSELLAGAERYDKFNKPLTAAAAGVARGATLGLSDVALTQSGLVEQETLAGLQEINPAASTAGEIAGAVAGAFTPATPARVAIGAGRAAEAALLSKAAMSAVEKTAARKIAEKAAAAGVGGAIEGAAFGTGQLISEAALGNADLNAENLVAAAGSGAALGGLVGGAFGTAFGSIDELGKVFNKDGKLKKLVQADFDPEMNAIKLVAPEGAESAKIMRMARGEVDGVPAFSVKDYLVKDLELQTLTSRQQLFERNAFVKSQALDDISNVVKAVDEAVTAPKLSRLELRARILKETMADLEKAVELPGARKAAKAELAKFIDQALDIDGKVRKFADKIELDPLTMTSVPSGATKGVTAKQLHELISGMGEAGFGSGITKTSAKAYQTAFGKTKDILRELADSADSTGGLAKRWDEANRRFRTALTLEKPLSARAAADMPLGDWKDAVLGSVGAMVGGASGAAAAVLSRRTLSSDLKKKLIVLGSANTATSNAAKRIADSTKNFFTKAARGVKKSSIPAINTIFWNSGLAQDFEKSQTRPVAPKNDKEAFKNISKNVSELAQNPDKLAYRTTAVTQKMDAYAPQIAQATRETMVRAVQFLDSKLPKDRNQQFDVLQDREFEPSSLVMGKFKRYVQVVEDPYSVLNDLEAGTATIEHIEALQQVYPQIYKEIRTAMIDYTLKNPTKLDYNQKTQLAILLQAPVVPSMRAKAIANFQASFIPKEPEQGGGVSMTVGGLGKLKMADQQMTEVERIQTNES